MIQTQLTKDIEKLSMENVHSEGFIFENQLNLPLTFHIQSVNGEKEPQFSYASFKIKPGELLFLAKAELKDLRKKQIQEVYGTTLKTNSEDALKIIIKPENWEYSSNIPIELAGCHSFLFTQCVQKLSKRSSKHSCPAVCHIKNNKAHKIITFESHIVLANNTIYDVELYSIKHKTSCISHMHSIDSREDEQRISLEKGSAVTVPFNWIYENRSLGILCKKDNIKVPFLLIQEFIKLFVLKMDERNDSTAQESQSKSIELITLKDGNKVNVSFDITAFRCHKVTKFTPFQYLLSFSSSLLIHNSLPHCLEVSYTSLAKTEKTLGTINSQNILELYDLSNEDFVKNRLTWNLYMGNTISFTCNNWQGVLEANTSSDHRLKFNSKSKSIKKGDQHELVLKASVRPNSNLINKYGNFALRNKIYEDCSRKKIIVYSSHAIVNKTDLSLKLKTNSDESIILTPHSNCLFDLGQCKSLCFKTKGFCIVAFE